MDNFMDKIAQKLSSQEIIKANAQAEAVQLRQMRAQFEAYDEFMKEMRTRLEAYDGYSRKMRTQLDAYGICADRMSSQIDAYEDIAGEMRALNGRNEELADISRQILKQFQEQAAEEPEEDVRAQELLEEIRQLVRRMEDSIEPIKAFLEENHSKVDEYSEKTEDFVHKENVKVYRNVQAVVQEELRAQTELFNSEFMKTKKQMAGVKPIVIAALVFSAVNAGILVVQLLNILGIM